MKSREMELIFKVVVIKKNKEEEIEINNLLEEHINWTILAGFLLNHRLGGYFVTGLSTEQKKKVPRELIKTLEMLVLGQEKRQEEIINEIRKISNALEKTDIKYAGLKGVIFGIEMYQLGARRSNDIDILVYERDLDKLDVVLRGLGYIQSFCKNDMLVEATKKEKIIQRMNYHDLVPYVKKMGSGYMEIDINFMFDGKTNEIDKEVFEMGTKKYKGNQYEFRGLSVNTGLAFLCTHFYREATEEIWINSKRNVTLYKLVDIMNYIRKYKSEIEMRSFINTMDKLNLIEKGYCVFSIIKEFYNDTFLEQFCDCISREMVLKIDNENIMKIKNQFLSDLKACLEI